MIEETDIHTQKEQEACFIKLFFFFSYKRLKWSIFKFTRKHKRKEWCMY